MRNPNDVDAALGVVLLYVPSAVARQMLCELARTRLARSEPILCETFREMTTALDRRGASLTYAMPLEGERR